MTMQVIGHRGAAALAPENTWVGFDRALEIGVDAIETDVHATSDGVLVLIHDARLERTTNGAGPVAETPWSAISQLDAGSWFDAKYAGASVPELGTTLDRYGQRTRIALEIKQPGIERAVLDLVRSKQLMARITFTSFDFATVASLRREDAEARIGYLTSDISHPNLKRTMDAGLDQFCPPASLVTPQLVSEWKALGLNVRAWGVKDEVLMAQAIEANVDGMTVDFPHLLLKTLGRTGT